MSVLPTGIWDEPISADLSASPIKTDSGANHNELMLGLEEMGQVLSMDEGARWARYSAGGSLRIPHRCGRPVDPRAELTCSRRGALSTRSNCVCDLLPFLLETSALY